MTLLEVADVRFGYDGRAILDGASLAVRPGEFVGLVGPNGAGKSTLIRLALGLLSPWSGSIRLGGEAVAHLSRAEVARRAALVPQETGIDFAFTAREVVEMGRNPWLGRFRPPGPADLEAVRAALAATGTSALADRPVNELSGGERQRVVLARALAQGAPLMILDEPTAHLDIAHQIEIMEIVRDLTRRGRGAVAAIHDLATAARYCDRVAFVSGGRIAVDGPPEEVVTEENLARYFHVRARVRSDEETGRPLVVPVGPVRR